MYQLKCKWNLLACLQKVSKEEAIDDAATLQAQLIAPSYGGVHQARKNAAVSFVVVKILMQLYSLKLILKTVYSYTR